jgi:adenine-specific DNA-methyltransferase
MEKFQLPPEYDTAQLQELVRIFPQFWRESYFDFDEFKAYISGIVPDDLQEKYSFTWHGKTESYRLLKKNSNGTLRPCKEDSVNWDTTQNLYIEGDNLEVLKLIKHTYAAERGVKMIYIDPPYNLGEEFIYDDNFMDSIEKYLEYTVQKGLAIPEISGRYHTKWLNMMYPRLWLANYLLSDDGVIFISIDNNEVHNLRKICDEVFGEENFVDCITWNTRVPKNDNKGLGNIHQYVLVYAKQAQLNRQFFMPKDGLDEVFELCAKMKRQGVPIPEAEVELKKLYTKKGFDRGITLYKELDENYEPWGKINMSWPNSDTFGPTFDVLHPKTNNPTKKPDRGWRWNEDAFEKNLDYSNIFERHDGSFVCGNLWFAKDEHTQPSSIKYLRDVDKMLLRTIVSLKSDGGVELEDILGSKSCFSNPKPTDLIELLIGSVEENDGIFLDFFSGSGTTAHAIMKLNANDGGTRRFIAVQIPERIDSKKGKAAIDFLKSIGKPERISEIGKERLRRAGEEISKNHPNVDVGFRVFKLDKSNFKIWDDTPVDPKNPDEVARLMGQLSIHADSPFIDGRSHEDIVYEIMRMNNYTLTTPIIPIEINGETVYGIGEDCDFIICIDVAIDEAAAEELCTYRPGRILFTDSCFKDTETRVNVEHTIKNINEKIKLRVV